MNGKCLVGTQAERRMDIQAPLTAVYFQAVPAVLAQLHSQLPVATYKPTPFHLSVPPLHSKDPLSSFTLHIPSGLQVQPGPSVAVPTPAARGKSAGKHVCPHCGRDCMKPSVLEKHLRCHTGERPYPCATCKVSFKTQSNLYKHRRTQAHARLSYESQQSSQSSLDSGSRETSFSSLSLDEQSDELAGTEKVSTINAAETKEPRSSGETKDAASQQNQSNCANDNLEPKESQAITNEEEKSDKPPSQHPSLQRQEATIFSKHWEGSLSRGNSQSHESTDSGFSESCDPCSSPGRVSSDHSIESIPEFCKEHLQNTSRSAETIQDGQTLTEGVREGEQKTLEQRISQLISQNTAVVEDKQLEHVRPRKTVLSKQGSIDLPMPYTYKDSFHFEMRFTPNDVSQTNMKPGLYSPVPPLSFATSSHTPITRSHSLPFSVTLLQPEGNIQPPSHHSDYVTFVRRTSSGQINPTCFALKPANQNSSTHRPLVRQAAVDCNYAAESLFSNRSVEEPCASSLSCDGGDISEETNNKKFRRRKSQKFAYDKWYMYGGGTFKKLYNVEKAGDNSGLKPKKCSTSPELEAPNRLKVLPKALVSSSSSLSTMDSVHYATSLPIISTVGLNPKTVLQSPKPPLQKSLSLSILSLPPIGPTMSDKTDCMNRTEHGWKILEEKHKVDTSQLCEAHIPSNRKKQKTEFQKVTLQDTNIDNHFPPLGIASNPRQCSKVTYSNVITPKDSTNKNTINGNMQPVASPTPSPSFTKENSFLPMYQLKIPNTADKASNLSLDLSEQKTESSSSSLSSDPNKILPLITTFCEHPNILYITQTCHNKNINSSSARSQLQFESLTAVPTVTIANSEKLANGAVKASSQDIPNIIPNPAPSETQITKSHSNGAALLPCPNAFDQVQQAAQNVFHVQTADLQICLQIISDEQLALIEAQIEQPLATGCSLSRDLEENQNKAQDVSVTTKISCEARKSLQKKDKECSFKMERQGKTLVLPEDTDWRSNPSDELEETHHCRDAQSSVDGDSESKCSDTVLSNVPQLKGGEDAAQLEVSTNPSLSDHLMDQTNSGMSESSPHSCQSQSMTRVPSVPASESQSSLFNLPQTPQTANEPNPSRQDSHCAAGRPAGGHYNQSLGEDTPDVTEELRTSKNNPQSQSTLLDLYSDSLQSMFSFEPSELRPVQSCHSQSEDSNSSDDEGKLIIEL